MAHSHKRTASPTPADKDAKKKVTTAIVASAAPMWVINLPIPENSSQRIISSKLYVSSLDKLDRNMLQQAFAPLNDGRACSQLVSVCKSFRGLFGDSSKHAAFINAVMTAKQDEKKVDVINQKDVKHSDDKQQDQKVLTYRAEDLLKAEALRRTTKVKLTEMKHVLQRSDGTSTVMTAFQQAFWALDQPMWEVIAKYMTPEEQKQQLQEHVDACYRRWEMLGKNMTPDQLQDHINLWNTGSPLHVNITPLREAYDEAWNLMLKAAGLTYDFEAVRTCLITKVGGEQRALLIDGATHFINQYCHPARPLAPLPDLEKEHDLPRSLSVNNPPVSLLPLTPKTGIGYQYWLYRGDSKTAHTTNEMHISGERTQDSTFMFHYHQKKLAAANKLRKTLQVVSKPMAVAKKEAAAANQANVAGAAAAQATEAADVPAAETATTTAPAVTFRM